MFFVFADLVQALLCIYYNNIVLHLLSIKKRYSEIEQGYYWMLGLSSQEIKLRTSLVNSIRMD